MTKTPKNAQIDGLSAEAKAVYARLTKEWAIKDGAGQLTLLTACQALDRLRQAQNLIAKEGITVKDKFGQTKIHPGTQIEKESRAGLLQALKMLNLDLESLEIDNAAKT